MSNQAAETPAEPATPADRKIDLDAARKARREKRGAPPSILFLGVERPLPASMPAEVIDLMGDLSEGDYAASTKAFRMLLGGETYEQILVDAKEAGEPLDLDDVVFLLERCMELYDVTPGESPGSGSSS